MQEQIPEADSSCSENFPSKTQAQVSLSGKVVIIICCIYLLLTIPFFFGTPLNFVLMNGMWSACFLVIYIGMPLACLAWAISIGYRIFIRKNRQSVILTGIKYGIIVFGIMGLVFWLWGMVPPTAKMFTFGYWIHAKVWVDVEEVRRWIKENEKSIEPNTNVPLAQWPSSLKMIPLYSGRLHYDKQNSTITLDEGGGFGHWGLTVAPKGATIPYGWFVLSLEDGAWVWHEYQ